MSEFVTYNVFDGFNIVSLDVSSLDEADEILGYDVKVLDYASEFDELILKRIREILK